MNLDIKLSLTVEQIIDMVRNLPFQYKVQISKVLEEELIDNKLTEIRETFYTEELSEEDILNEVEIVRAER